MRDKKDILDELKESVIEMDPEQAAGAAREALEEGIDPVKCINEGLSPGMMTVNERFSEGEVFVPELTLASEAFEEAVRILAVRMTEEGKQNPGEGVVVLHTVQGDNHELGKNIVRIMLTAAGFRVYDIGCNVSPLKVIEEARKYGADIIIGSALMTTTLAAQREEILLLKKMGLRDRFFCMFGGTPVSLDWCRHIGADAYSDTASDAVRVARELMKRKRAGEKPGEVEVLF